MPVFRRGHKNHIDVFAIQELAKILVSLHLFRREIEIHQRPVDALVPYIAVCDYVNLIRLHERAQVITPLIP